MNTLDFVDQASLRDDIPAFGPGDTVNALAFFDDYGPDNGATRLVPGSHRPAPDAPPFAAIVEELFPIEAVGDLSAFFGAADDADLADRMSRMVASTSSFGASTNIDTVPTSRYVLRSPFADPA